MELYSHCIAVLTPLIVALEGGLTVAVVFQRWLSSNDNGEDGKEKNERMREREGRMGNDLVG